MSSEEEFLAAYQGLRSATAWSEREAEEVVCLRLRGEGAYDLLDRACPTELLLRDGQMRQSLFLSEEGRPIADLLMAHDDEDYLLFIEGIGGEVAKAHLERAAALLREEGEEPEVEILDRSGARGLLSLHGPYAWELLGELFGSDVVALPYLCFFPVEGGLCLRAGTTGEYGYDLWLEAEALHATRERLLALGEAFDLVRASPAVLERCAFENAFFDPRSLPEGEGGRAITPVELQLQWRLSRQKEFLGSAALKERRAEGIRERLTYLVAEAEVFPGDRLLFEGEEIGHVHRAARSPMRGDWVAQALIRLPYAHSSVDRYRLVGPEEEARPVRTLGPPVVDNRSLFVDPRRHSYRFREEDRFPPIVPADPLRAPRHAAGGSPR